MKPAGFLKEPEQLAFRPEALELGLRLEHHRQLERRGRAWAQHRREQCFQRFQLLLRVLLGPAVLRCGLSQRLTQGAGSGLALLAPLRLILL